MVTNNIVFGNQVGMFLAESDEISGNDMFDNDFFGLTLIGVIDGAFTIEGGSIRGGGGGVWVTPVIVDMSVLLRKVRFSGLSGPAVKVLDGADFKATITTKP